MHHLPYNIFFHISSKPTLFIMMKSTTIILELPANYMSLK